jgi:hypothetical protein
MKLIAVFLMVCLLVAPALADVRMVQGSSDTPFNAYKAEKAVNGTLMIYMSPSTLDYLPDPAPVGVAYIALQWL